MMKNQLSLNANDGSFQEITNKEPLLLREIIELLKIDDSKEHLSESVYLSVLRLYACHKKDSRGGLPIYNHISLFKNTLKSFPSLELWENVPSHKKIIRTNNGTNFLYYCIMVMCRRMKLDWLIFEGRGLNMPQMIPENEKMLLCGANENLRFSKDSADQVINFISKIMLATGKKLSLIDENDIYEYRDANCGSRKMAKRTFNILKYLNYLNTDSNYVNKYLYEEKTTDDLRQFNEVYTYWIDYVESHYPPTRTYIYTKPAKSFLKWLIDNKKDLKKLNMLNIEHIEMFSSWLKAFKSPNTGEVLSKSTVTSRLSALKKFLYFLSDKDLINQDFKNKIHHIEKYYYKGKKGAQFPVPVPIEDRRKIDKGLANFEWPSNPVVPNLLRLLYYLGPRPSEGVTLAWDCLKGSEETPFLHFHRTKNFRERWVPLAPVELSLIKELQEYNKDSVSIYHEFDNKSIKRLFHYQGNLVTLNTLNNAFHSLQIDHGIVTETGEPKYSIYILRKIRITTWLEAGISRHDVAYLVGHGDVDSHNYYLIGKESRIANAQKAYNEWYKDMIQQVADKGFYEKPKEIGKDKEYIEKLQDALLQIETKSFNKTMFESITRDIPELLAPVPCGKCFALAVLGEEYECERMKFPCLECSELDVTDNSIKYFDNYVERVYKSKSEKVKAGLDGLVFRDEALLTRLKRFYTVKFFFTAKDVEIHFEKIESRCSSKRGRPKK